MVKDTQIIDQATYPYVFTPLSLEGLPISRRTTNLEIYEAPYKDFPVLYLPLHPYAAIVHAYEAFIKFGPLNLTNEQLQIFNNIERIWSLWEVLGRTSFKPSPNRVSSVPSSPNNSDNEDVISSDLDAPIFFNSVLPKKSVAGPYLTQPPASSSKDDSAVSEVHSSTRKVKKSKTLRLR